DRRSLLLPGHAAGRGRGCRRHVSFGHPGEALPLDPALAPRRGHRGGTQVSLRTDIHLAFDELSPATAGMRDRVVQSAGRERVRRPSLSISVIRLRAQMSLVAVLLVIAIVAGILH